MSKYLLSIVLLTFMSIQQAQAALPQTFPDAPADAWFTPYVERVVEEGLMEGYPDGNFGSWDPINRAEFAKVVLELKDQLQEKWWEKHLYEILLVLVTIGGWMTISRKMELLSKRLERPRTPLKKPSTDQESITNKTNKNSQKHTGNWWNQ